MQKNYFIYFLAVITILFTGIRGEAFVPETPHLLYLMVEKIGMPKAMTVSQTRQVFPATLNDQVAETEIIKEISPKIEGEIITESIGDTRATGVTVLTEILTYAFPDRLRGEIRNGKIHRFYALSDEGFVKVENGSITGLEQGPGEYYTDLLLYKDHEKLIKILARGKINTEKVTLQRLDGEICWFVGDPAYGGHQKSGVWIGQDSFFPKRYLFRNAGRTIDIRYTDWERIARFWYPRNIVIFQDGKRFAQITVDNMSLTSKVPNSLFDVIGIRERYWDQSVLSDIQDNSAESIERVDTINE